MSSHKVNWSLVHDATRKDRKHEGIVFVRPSNPINGFNPGSIATSTSSTPGPPPPGTNVKTDAGAKKERELFGAQLVLKYMHWLKISRPGPGLFNMGNTCFLNSTLQCLLHTPALAQILQLEANKALIGIAGRSEFQQVTISQHFQRLVLDAWSPNAGRAISPRSMVHNVRRVGKQFRPQRQEDAHEYLVQLLDCMHEEVLKANGVKLSDGKVAESTFIGRIFGGDLCNELKCSKCKFSSKTYNHFQDLSLEVSPGISSVDGAISAFVKPERLSAGNEWHCDGCKTKVQATKCMNIAKSPNVLVLHLKRFSFGSGKINKPIDFSERLFLPCSDGTEDVKGRNCSPYDLSGLVVHHGGSVHSGHYVAFVKAAGGSWFEMNDSTVSAVSRTALLRQQAYILFYHKILPTSTPIPAALPSKVAKQVSPMEDNKKDLQDLGEEVTRVSTSGDKRKREVVEIEDEWYPAEMWNSMLIFQRHRLPIRRCPVALTMRWSSPATTWLKDRFVTCRSRWSHLQPLRRTKVMAEKEQDESDDEDEYADNYGDGDSFDDSNSDGDESVDSDSASEMIYEPEDQNATLRPDNGMLSTVSQALSQQSRRSKEAGQGGEGLWDANQENTLAWKNEQQAALKRKEQQLLASRQPSEWDHVLDQGRSKKVKLSAEADARLSAESGINRFQAVADSRGNTRQLFNHRDKGAGRSGRGGRNSGRGGRGQRDYSGTDGYKGSVRW